MRIIVAKIPSQIVAGNRGSKAIVTQRIRKNSGEIPEFLPAPASDFGGYVLGRRSSLRATSLNVISMALAPVADRQEPEAWAAQSNLRRSWPSQAL